MPASKYEQIKSAVLSHIQSLFDELEKEMALSHQEKYALLEDAFESATDEEELKVAFDQWHTEHAEDLKLEEKANDLWAQALGEKGIEYGNYKDDSKDEDEVESGEGKDNFEEEEEPKDDYSG